jgi:RNA polymerase sigma-70 factor (ECF subfamily)
MKLLSAMKTYRCDSGTSFRGWLKTVTHNARIDFVRRPRASQAPDWLSSIVDSSDSLEDLQHQIVQALEREIVELAMKRVESRVKASHWEAFRLTSIENLSGAEAASRACESSSRTRSRPSSSQCCRGMRCPSASSRARTYPDESGDSTR